MNNQRFEVKEKESEDYEEWFDCQWCKESFPKSELHEEVDLEYLCDRCVRAIHSRGETLNLKY